jgi:GTP-binding protein Era
VDVVVMVAEGERWTDADQAILARLREQAVPLLLALNKVDLLPDKRRLLPRLQELDASGAFRAVIPLSAHTGSNVEALEKAVCDLLPEGVPQFPADQITDRSERFLAAEVIREKLTRLLDQELPYRISVEIEKFQRTEKLATLDAVIWVERDSQKAIVIGRSGEVLKRVGTRARSDLERLLGQQVLLHLWVRVKERWTDDEQALARLGYVDPDG